MGMRAIPLKVTHGPKDTEATFWVEPGNTGHVELVVPGVHPIRVEIFWLEIQSLVADHVRRERIAELEQAGDDEILGLKGL